MEKRAGRVGFTDQSGHGSIELRVRSDWVYPYFSNKFFFFFFQLQKQINDNLFKENEKLADADCPEKSLRG